MIQENEVARACNEANQVGIFIQNWQENNEYTKETLLEYNSKFKKEFNEFLSKSGFLYETISFFSIK